MASQNKNILTKNPTESKNFAYSFGNVQLTFSLRVDIKTELVDFLRLLEEASKDVRLEIAERFPQVEGTPAEEPQDEPAEDTTSEDNEEGK